MQQVDITDTSVTINQLLNQVKNGSSNTLILSLRFGDFGENAMSDDKPLCV
jgi:hypothetical protein